MTDVHNKDEDSQTTGNTTGALVSQAHPDGRSARERAMHADYDKKVWGEIQEDGEGWLIENPIPLAHKMSVGEKTRRACALKLSGASYASIARTLGYNDASAARKAVVRGMDTSMQENAKELRKLHYGRLEHMLGLLWSDVNAKDLPSMRIALDVMDRMDRLYGLSAPDRLDVTAGGRETVIVADGDKDSYLKALREAGAEIALPAGETGDY